MADIESIQRLIQLALRMTGASDGIVVLRGAYGRVRRCVHSSVEEPAADACIVAEQIVAMVSENPRPTIVTAADANVPGREHITELLGHVGTSSILVAPLTHDSSGDLGAMAIWDHAPERAWTAADLDVVREFAAIQSATLVLRETLLASQVAEGVGERRARATESERLLSELLSAPGSLRSVLVAAAKHLKERLAVSTVRIWRIDPTGGHLRLAAVWEDDSRLDEKPPLIAVGERRIGRIAATRRPFVVDDLSRDVHRDRSDWPEPDGLIAFAGFPIELDGRLLGVLAVASPEPFDDDRLDALQSASRIVATAIVRKEAEGQLRASEARKSAILESALDAIITIDSTGCVLEFNPAAERMFGYARTEVISRSLAELIVPPAMREAHKRGLKHYLATGEGPVLGKRIEIDALHADGTLFPVELAITVVPLDGPPVFTAYLRDISGRREAEALIRDRETRLQSIVETAVDGIIVIDEQGRVESFNPAAERLFGYSAAEMLGQSVDILMTASDASRHHLALRQFISSGESHVVGRRREVNAVRHDGTAIPIELSVSAMRIGESWKFTGMARGLSEQRRAAHELARTNELLESVRAIQLQYISDEDPRRLFDTMLQHALRASGSEFGFVGEVLVGEDGVSFMRTLALSNIAWDEPTRRRYGEEYASGLVFRNLETLFGHVITTGKPVISNDPSLDPRRGGTPPGHPPLERFACLPLDMAGRLVGMIGLANRPEGYDEHLLTELNTLFSACAGVLAGFQETRRRREAEASLALAKERAEAASKAKSDFLANMSHEVRTPMASVLGYADMLLEPGLSSTDRDHALQGIRRNGEHLIHLIDDILDLSKIEAGKLEPELMPVALRTLAHDVVSLHQGRAMERGVALQTCIEGRIPARTRTDPVRVRQVLVNLLSNAIKFTSSGGMVTLRMSAEAVSGEQAAILFVVEDSGIGMSERQLGQLFQPFQQADSSTTRRYGGTGLGLSICKGIVDALGGTITVESRSGLGSRFTVRLPVEAESVDNPWEVGEPDKAEVTPRPAAGGATLKGRVLLAEDSRDLQRIIGQYLHRAGLEVETVEDGLQALDAVVRQPFDLVLLDMQMPRLDGYSAAGALRRAGYRGPIVALTAHALKEDRERCLAAGCTDYLVKPVHRHTLIDCVQKHLGRRERSDDAAETSRRNNGRDEDPALAALRRDYVDSLRQTITSLGRACATNDLRVMLTIAHQTRGVAGMHGYQALTETAGLIEDALREQEDQELIKELVGDFVQCAENILRNSDVTDHPPT